MRGKSLAVADAASRSAEPFRTLATLVGDGQRLSFCVVGVFIATVRPKRVYSDLYDVASCRRFWVLV